MTVHFAAARSTARSPVARALARRAAGRAANDNGTADLLTASNDQLLHDALRHFAQHGLGSARAARKQAEAAMQAGDNQGYEWWLGICGTLDKRMADQLRRANQVFEGAKREG